MKFFMLAFALLFLIACDHPSPYFYDDMTTDDDEGNANIDTLTLNDDDTIDGDAEDPDTFFEYDESTDAESHGATDQTAENDPSDEDGDESSDQETAADTVFVDETPDLDTIEPPGNITLVVLSDTHFSGDEEKIERAQKIITAINKQEGNFTAVDALVITGDVISKIYPDWPDTTECHIDVAVGALAPLAVPYYLGLGNHDYNLGYQDTNWGGPFTEQEILQAEAAWLEKAATPPYFAVMIKGWKLIFLNSMRGYYLQRNFDDAQLAWFAAELSDGVPAFVFLHHPIETDNFKVWTGPNENIPKLREPQFYQILSDHRDTIKAILVGHGHLWVNDTLYGSIPVQETASLGETNILTGEEPHTIIEGKPDRSVTVKDRKDL